MQQVSQNGVALSPGQARNILALYSLLAKAGNSQQAQLPSTAQPTGNQQVDSYLRGVSAMANLGQKRNEQYLKSGFGSQTFIPSSMNTPLMVQRGAPLAKMSASPVLSSLYVSNS